MLLITVDTLRADHLGCYGATRGTSPALDALAARGTVFEQARVPIPRTTQSLASLMTGLLPPLHGVRELWDVLDDRHETLAEVLRDHGYTTGGVWAVPFFEGGQGLEQGFDFRRHWRDDVDAAAVTDAALAFLDRVADKRFFLWVHYRDPHMPYGPPPTWADRFGTDTTGRWPQAFFYYPIRGRTTDVHALPADQRARKAAVVYGAAGLGPEDHRRARDLYDGEVAFTDAEIERLLAGIDAPGRLARTLVVVTADHGESLGEHQYFYDHGDFLYDTCLRVPLVMAGPGVARGRVAEPVSTVDLRATLLDLLRIAPVERNGQSFALAVRGGRVGRSHPAFAEAGALLVVDTHARRPIAGPAGLPVSVVSGRWKLIETPGVATAGGEELYDLGDDPAEVHDLAAEPPATAPVAELRRALAEWAKVVRTPRDASRKPDAETVRRLQSIGYIDAQ